MTETWDESPPDGTEDQEALSAEEWKDAEDPDVGEGTPDTAPDRPPPETLLERARRLMGGPR